MAVPPLQLEELFYDQLVVTARHGAAPAKEPEGNLRTDARFSHSTDDDRLWRVELEVGLGADAGSPPPKYEVAVHAVGVFRIHPEFPEEAIPKLVGITGTSIVYTSVRDFLMTITSRGPWGVLLLPTTSFTDVELRSESDDETLAATIRSALRERGPLRLAELARVLDVPIPTLRRAAARLRREGVIELTGRGAGARYRTTVRDPARRVAERQSRQPSR